MNETTKIATGIERLSTVFRAALWEEAKQSGLSPLQAQILLFIASHVPLQSSVSSLAKEFAVTKATVSDAVRVLLEKNMLKKQSGNDGRAFSLALTVSGKKLVKRLGALSDYFDKTLTAIPPNERKKIWEGLWLLMGHLQNTGIIPLRMCLSCQHYGNHKDTPYCHLMQQTLQLEDLRLDCPEHLLVA